MLTVELPRTSITLVAVTAKSELMVRQLEEKARRPDSFPVITVLSALTVTAVAFSLSVEVSVLF